MGRWIRLSLKKKKSLRADILVKEWTEIFKRLPTTQGEDKDTCLFYFC